MALTQSHFRFGINELAQSTHGWHAAEDVSVTLPADATFLLRFCVQANATGLSNVDNEFQYNRNGAGWVNITTSSAIVKAVTTTVFTNGANCTKRLSGTGTFETSAAGCTHDGTSGGSSNDIVASGNSETECALQVVGANVVRGDVIQFRLRRDGGLLLDTYAVTPSLTVGGPVTLVAAGGTYSQTGTAAALKASRKIVAGASSYTLTGSAAALLHGYPLVAAPGAFGLAGVPAGLLATRGLQASGGAYAFEGASAGLLAGRRLDAQAAAFTWTGTPADLVYEPVTGYTLAAGAGAFVLSPSQASLL